MWELLTGEEPYANMHYGAIIGLISSPSSPADVSSTCVNLISTEVFVINKDGDEFEIIDYVSDCLRTALRTVFF